MKKNKKIRVALMICLALASLILLASCHLFVDTSPEQPDPQEEPKHPHELTFVEGIAPTCTTKGVEGYYECQECNKLYSDSKGNYEIASPIKVERIDHNLVVVPEKPSTCTEEGETEHLKCSVCDRILELPEKIAHTNITINGKHCCNSTLNDHGVEGLTITYENHEYTISGNNAVITTLGADNVTLNIGDGVTIAPKNGSKAITANNAKLNFVGGEVLINGTVETVDSYLTIDNGAVVTIDGGYLYTKGELTYDLTQEYEYQFRLFVRQGTLNINHDNDGKAVLWSNSIQVGSEKDNAKGYININSGTDSGIRIDDDFVTRWMFANGELNFVGEKADNCAIKLGGNKGKNVDFMPGMKVSVKNYKTAFFAEWLYVYLAFSSDTFTLENVDTAVAANKRLRIYTHQIVQVEYTDEEGNTGLANVILEGGEIIANVNAGESYSDFSFIDFPTAEDYESWSGKKTFVSWVR